MAAGAFAEAVLFVRIGVHFGIWLTNSFRYILLRMAKYALNIRDEAKGKNLVLFLKTLDFVKVSDLHTPKKSKKRHPKDFFAAQGIWKEHQITGKELRELAWNRGNR
jgi:hypothetical protein